MKIGIITVHRAHNCGAMLQALALQESLKRLGHTPVLVEANAIGEWKTIPEIPTYWKCWPFYIKDLILSMGIRSRKVMMFKRFLRHMSLSPKYNTAKEIPEAEYDAFIVGSDQVWNLDIVKDATLFLLEFCRDKKKKMAYAASFGVTQIPSSWTQPYCTALAQFSAITVREDQAAVLVQSLIGLKPHVVLDPTLLLVAQDYARYESVRLIKQPYVLVYSIGAASEYMLELGRRISEKKNLKLVFVNATSFGNWLRIFNEYQLISPDRFLSYIKHAECVVCTSYHATIFSLHYRRPFLTILPKGSHVTSRLISLLSKLGLEGHLLCEGAVVENVEMRMDADFNNVHDRIDILRQKSVSELREMTKG